MSLLSVAAVAAGPANSWKCDVCLIKNDPHRTICEACETPKPGAVVTSGPKFHFDTKSNSSPSPFLQNAGMPLPSNFPPPIFGTGGFTAPATTTSVFGNHFAGTSAPPLFGNSSSVVDGNENRLGRPQTTFKKMSLHGRRRANAVDRDDAGKLDDVMMAGPAVVNDASSSDSSTSHEDAVVFPRGFHRRFVVEVKNDSDENLKTFDAYIWGTGECDQLPFQDEELDECNALPLPKQIDKLSVQSIACGALHSLAIVSSGRVLSWGCNDESTLGRKGDERVPGFVQGLEDAEMISCGDNHSACITGLGDCYIWGVYKDSSGFIGFPKYTPKQQEGGVKQRSSMPTKVLDLPGPCTMLVSGENHDAVLCTPLPSKASSRAKGSRTGLGPLLYVWGDTEFGQLALPPIEGHGEDVDKAKYDKLFPQRHTVDSLSLRPGDVIHGLYSGGGTTFISVQSSPLHETASSTRGRRRVPGNKKNSETTVLSRSNPPTSEFRYYGCGRNFNGEVGIGTAGSEDKAVNLEDVGENARITKFTEISCLRGVEIKSIMGGQFFSAALSHSGDVYTWGLGEMTGHGDEWRKKCVKEPKRVDGLDAIAKDVGKVDSIGVGAGTGFLTTKTGLLFSWGDGISNQLGTGRDEFDPVVRLQCLPPGNTDNKFAVRATGGSQHTVALYAPLPSDAPKSEPQPIVGPPVKRRRVAAGGESDGRVVSLSLAPASSQISTGTRETNNENVRGRKRIKHTAGIVRGSEEPSGVASTVSTTINSVEDSANAGQDVDAVMQFVSDAKQSLVANAEKKSIKATGRQGATTKDRAKNPKGPAADANHPMPKKATRSARKAATNVATRIEPVISEPAHPATVQDKKSLPAQTLKDTATSCHTDVTAQNVAVAPRKRTRREDTSEVILPKSKTRRVGRSVAPPPVAVAMGAGINEVAVSVARRRTNPSLSRRLGSVTISQNVVDQRRNHTRAAVVSAVKEGPVKAPAKLTSKGTTVRKDVKKTAKNVAVAVQVEQNVTNTLPVVAKSKNSENAKSTRVSNRERKV